MYSSTHTVATANPYRSRVIDAELDELFASLPAILIDGPKGVGKTATAARRASSQLQLDQPTPAGHHCSSARPSPGTATASATGRVAATARGVGCRETRCRREQLGGTVPADRLCEPDQSREPFRCRTNRKRADAAACSGRTRSPRTDRQFKGFAGRWPPPGDGNHLIRTARLRA